VTAQLAVRNPTNGQLDTSGEQLRLSAPRNATQTGKKQSRNGAGPFGGDIIFQRPKEGKRIAERREEEEGDGQAVGWAQTRAGLSLWNSETRNNNVSIEMTRYYIVTSAAAAQLLVVLGARPIGVSLLLASHWALLVPTAPSIPLPDSRCSSLYFLIYFTPQESSVNRLLVVPPFPLMRPLSVSLFLP
jgi:hypothetical protein